MVLVVIATVILGFFFPPIWLALIGYGIYMYASRKSRRDEAVEGRVKRMVDAGRINASFPDLYFEAARSYAIAKGANAPEADAASAKILIEGTSYFVVFMRESGGTAISVERSSDVTRELEKFLPEELRTYR